MADPELTTIDRNSPLPYYVQLKETLRSQIELGIWKTGSMLPGEPELCRLFDVSRTVVRQALREMTFEGLIVRRKGKGTFVAAPKIRESLVQKLTGFHQDMVERGITPKTQVLARELVRASAEVAESLRLMSGAEVVRIDRLRFVHDDPIVFVTTFLPLALCPRLMQVDFSNRSLYAFLENECGLELARGRRIIEAVPAGEREASLLRVKKGAPLILLESVSYLSDGAPLEFYRAFHRGDRSRFEVELVRVGRRNEAGERTAAVDLELPPASSIVDNSLNPRSPSLTAHSPPIVAGPAGLAAKEDPGPGTSRSGSHKRSRRRTLPRRGKR